jgi:hypothetical protein
MTKWTRVAALAAVALLVVSGAFAQTSGRIEGTVQDSNGAALPGVTLTATSSTLPGNVTAVTDGGGNFRLLSLPPGNYTVAAALEGFNNIEQRDIRVGIDRTVTLQLTMTAAFAGELTVLGDAPVVDTASATAGVSMSAETFDRIPMTRDFYAVAQVATGAATDATGTTVYGSTGVENAYVIEGLNTTGAERGEEAKTLNFDFIQEVEIKTGGLPAEYGRLTGGLINAITKSGGNEFNGDLFGFYEGGDLQSDDSTRSERSVDATQIVDTDSRLEYGFDLGGYFVKDKLWFFAAYNRVDRTDATTVINFINSPGSPAPGTVVEADIEEDLYAAKLTWRINSNNNLSATLFGDPTERTGNVFNISGPPSTWDGTRETGSDDFVLRYDGVFGSSWVVEGLAGLHQEEDTTVGPGKSLPHFIDTRPSGPDATSGGFTFHQDQEFEREVFKLDVSKFLGNVELKFGADQEDTSSVNANWNGGAGQRIYIFNNRADPNGPTVYRHRFYINDQAPGFVIDDPSTWQIATPLVSEPNSVSSAAYAQVSWKAMPNFTLNLGARYEKQEVNDRFGETTIELDDNWAPRIAFVWDPQANGRSKLFGSFGRYYENIPLDINIRAFGGEVQAFAYNFSPDPNDITPLDESLTGFRNSTLGGTTPVDPDLEGQFIDEFLLGYEYEIMPNFAVGIQGTYRELGQVIEDFLISPTTGYFIANPGQGIGSGMTFYDYETVAAPEARREFTGIELNARKRFSDGWQLYASYLWSELEGNYDGLFQASTGQLDPNINSAFDYADFLINADGKLSNDRTHTFKTSGSYTVQDGALADLTVGLSAYWRSGTPQTAYGYSPGYQNWEYYLTPRGSVGRNPSDYEMDLHVGYPLKVGEYEIQFLLDVFNLLDRQAVINYDQRYNENGDACGGVPFGLCAGDFVDEDGVEHRGSGSLQHDGPSLTPIGQLPALTPSNPSFLRDGRNDAAFSGQRNIRLGVRFRF